MLSEIAVTTKRVSVSLELRRTKHFRVTANVQSVDRRHSSTSSTSFDKGAQYCWFDFDPPAGWSH